MYHIILSLSLFFYNKGTTAKIWSIKDLLTVSEFSKACSATLSHMPSPQESHSKRHAKNKIDNQQGKKKDTPICPRVHLQKYICGNVYIWYDNLGGGNQSELLPRMGATDSMGNQNPKTIFYFFL